MAHNFCMEEVNSLVDKAFGTTGVVDSLVENVVSINAGNKHLVDKISSSDALGEQSANSLLGKALGSHAFGMKQPSDESLPDNAVDTNRDGKHSWKKCFCLREPVF